MSDDTAVIHIDGASRGNPGDAAYAVVINAPGRPAVEEFGDDRQGNEQRRRVHGPHQGAGEGEGAGPVGGCRSTATASFWSSR